MGHILQHIINYFKLKVRTDKSIATLIDTDLKTDLFSNLEKTIGWTEKIILQTHDTPQVNYSTILRKTNLLYEGKPFYKYHNTLYNYASTAPLPFNYKTILTDALILRSTEPMPSGDLRQFGRIIQFEIDLTTYDGAPCAESDGFIDESDIPPIDTWFYVTKKYLYCWIPTMFMDKMQAAIDVEIYGSYNWLDELYPELNHNILSSLRKQSGS